VKNLSIQIGPKTKKKRLYHRPIEGWRKKLSKDIFNRYSDFKERIIDNLSVIVDLGSTDYLRSGHCGFSKKYGFDGDKVIRHQLFCRTLAEKMTT
jgi:hypothetical protein